MWTWVASQRCTAVGATPAGIRMSLQRRLTLGPRARLLLRRGIQHGM
uniref:Uncharacterized protein n=1 Tax=Arundo donax TaxID=35708 RepID=A0A0A9CEY6_ARUDO